LVNGRDVSGFWVFSKPGTQAIGVWSIGKGGEKNLGSSVFKAPPPAARTVAFSPPRFRGGLERIFVNGVGNGGLRDGVMGGLNLGRKGAVEVGFFLCSLKRWSHGSTTPLGRQKLVRLWEIRGWGQPPPPGHFQGKGGENPVPCPEGKEKITGFEREVSRGPGPNIGATPRGQSGRDGTKGNAGKGRALQGGGGPSPFGGDCTRTGLSPPTDNFSGARWENNFSGFGLLPLVGRWEKKRGTTGIVGLS